MYWIISAFFLFFLVFLENACNAYQKNTVRFFSFVSFTIIITNSYYNGVDWINYITHYNNLAISGLTHRLAFIYEPGYVYLNWFFAYVLGIKNYFIIPFICNLIFSISLFYTLNRAPYKVNISLYLFLSLLFFSSLFNDGYRQLLSIAIILPFILKINIIPLKKWILICLIASLFHFSALMLIPFWWLLRIRLSINKVYLLIISSVLLIIILYNLSVVSNLLSSILSPIMQRKLTFYIQSLNEGFKFGFFMIFDIIGILIIIKEIRNKNEKKSDNYLLTSVFIYFLFHFSFYFAPFFQRILLYIYPLLMLYIFSFKKNVFISFIIIAIGILSFFRYTTNPYYSADFWEPKLFFTEIFKEESLNLKNLKEEKCSVIEKYDNNFCKNGSI